MGNNCFMSRLSSEGLCREASECLCAVCASLHFILDFNQSWGKGRHSNIYNDVLVTCDDESAVQLLALLSIQCSGVKYSHPTDNGENEAWGREVILLQLCSNIFTFSFQNFMKGHGIKEVCFRGIISHSHLGRHWVSAQGCCSEPPAKCCAGMWNEWSPT